MNKDTIYREDAIEAIRRLPNASTNWYVSARAVFDVLFGLPSAEPEIIRCKDCKYYQQDHLFKVGFCDGRQRNNDDFCSRAERRTDATD